MKYRYLLLLALVWPSLSMAQDSLLLDRNGDGLVRIDAFGDSITFGVGDGGSRGEVPPTDGTMGYPARVSGLVGVPVTNLGEPGEEILVDGLSRFADEIPRSNSDIITLMEGTNDAVHRAEVGDYSRALQKAANAARALGKLPILITLPPPQADHESLSPFTHSYSQAVRELTIVNDLPLVDIERAWQSTCQTEGACDLYNLPEGLHPNSKGYDVFSQTVVATLLGINIFAPEGAVELETALGLAPGTIIVKPDEITE